MRKLLLITLLVPLLSLASEVEFESLEEELAAERRELVEDKVAQLRHMQDIMETVQSSKAVQEEAEREPGLLMKIYTIGFILTGSLAIASWLYIAIKTMWQSIRVNYHHFIEYGEFVIFPTDDGDINRQMKEIIRKFDYAIVQSGSITEFTWLGCLGYLLIGGLFFTVLVFIWPISWILFGPDIAVELIAAKKRKKKIFEKKLQGKNVGTV
jgi:hypothetical protein